MEKYEIKKMGIKSVIKVSIYFLAIPMFLILLVGILLVVGGILTGKYELIGFGISYIMMFIIIIPFSAVMYALMAAFYNLFAAKFGGLEISLESKENKIQE